MERGGAENGWGITDKLRSVLGGPSLIWIHDHRKSSDRRNDALVKKKYGSSYRPT